MSAYFPIGKFCKNDLERLLGLFVDVDVSVPIVVHSFKSSLMIRRYQLIASINLVLSSFEKSNLSSVLVKSGFH